MRELLPTASLQFLTGEINDENIDFMVKYNLDIDAHYPALDVENIKLLKQRSIKINCWTVNDEFAAEDLVNLGVDYITTNILE